MSQSRLSSSAPTPGSSRCTGPGSWLRLTAGGRVCAPGIWGAGRRARAIGGAGRGGRPRRSATVALAGMCPRSGQRADAAALAVLAADGGLELGAAQAVTREPEQRRVHDGVADLAASQGAAQRHLLEQFVGDGVLARQ